MVKKFNLFLVSFLVASGITLAQNDGGNTAEDDGDDLSDLTFRERTYVGGDIGLNFWGGASYINIAPMAGYYVDPNWSFGVGLKYSRYRNNFYNYTDHYYGGSIFSRYDLGEIAFLHAELETLSVDDSNPFSPTYGGKTWVKMGFAGVGLKRGSPNMFYQFMVLYDLIDDRNSPYQFQYLFDDIPLIIRGGFVIRLG